MHNYTTDGTERRNIPFIIVTVSVVSTWAILGILEYFECSIHWWIGGPSVLGVYGIFYTLFNNYIWKLQILRRIGLVKTPVINGIWKGHIRSSFDEFQKKTKINLQIKQKWNKILIQLSSKTSKSKSIMASITTNTLIEPILTYEYINEPKANTNESMHIHHGTSRLILYSSKNILEGEYYTGRDRQNYGTLRANHKEREV